MKLSIIVSFYKNYHLNIFDNLKKSINKDVEFIFMIDDLYPEDYQKIYEIKKVYSDQIQLVFHKKRSGTGRNYFDAIRYAKGEYVSFVSVSTVTGETDLNKLVDVLNKNDADVIEFQPFWDRKIDWYPKQRLEPNKVYKTIENPAFIALSYPIIFNKVFKKDLFKSIDSSQVLLSNSKYSISLLYNLLINAKTYLYLNVNFRKYLVHSEKTFSLNNFIKEWKLIDENDNVKSQFTAEIEYAKHYFFVVFLPALVSEILKTSYLKRIAASKQSISEKMEIEIDKFFEKQKFLEFQNNKYLKNNLLEISLMKKRTSKKDWKDIFEKLQ
ncbi:glycosyltransferase [Mycoplasmopsis agassizii]|uniref:glycosyltransferase n=1 Tax=Mycoplasmopsis agassizii TaxID=33922 RepID=UPI003529BB3E